MCAEEDPLHCHRFLMICPELLERGVTPVHIRRGGVLESQREAEDRLLAQNDLTAFTSDSLFVGERGSALEDALRRQAKGHAFRANPEQMEDY
jgi:type II secretory pathway component PulF